MEVKVKLSGLENLKIEAKQRTHIEEGEEVIEVVKKVSFECSASAGELARVISLMDRRSPIYCIIGSDQAALDLHVESFDAKVKEKEPVAA